jgi:hypothetical protein
VDGADNAADGSAGMGSSTVVLGADESTTTWSKASGEADDRLNVVLSAMSRVQTDQHSWANIADTVWDMENFACTLCGINHLDTLLAPSA